MLDHRNYSKGLRVCAAKLCVFGFLLPFFPLSRRSFCHWGCLCSDSRGHSGMVLTTPVLVAKGGGQRLLFYIAMYKLYNIIIILNTHQGERNGSYSQRQDNGRGLQYKHVHTDAGRVQFDCWRRKKWNVGTASDYSTVSRGGGACP